MSLSLKDVTGVNRRHPLNRNRVAWWLCLPRTMGGRQWFDLMGRNHGRLFNMTNAATRGWRASPRPGGAGHIASVVDAYVFMSPLATGVIGSGDFTISAWVAPTSYGAALSGGIFSTATNVVVMYCAVSSSQFGAVINGTSISSGASLSAGAWQRVAMVRSGTNVAFYVNGVLSPSGGTSSYTFPASNSVILANDFDAANSLNGSIDDACIWSRALSAAEILQDYNLSRAGYPGVLLREGDHA